MYQEQILSKIFEYLKLKKYPYKKYGKLITVLCPICKDLSLTARIIPHTSIMKCLNPDCQKKFSLVTVVRNHEKEYSDITKYSKEDIIGHLKNLLNIDVLTEKEEIEVNRWFNIFQVENKFSIIPVKAPVKECKCGDVCELCAGKIPIPEKWQSTPYYNIKDTQNWLSTGLNLGIVTGKISGCTVIDIDCLSKVEKKELAQAIKNRNKIRTKELKQKIVIPEEIKSIMGETLVQKTFGGFHLIYKYEEDLPKTVIKFDNYHLDLENDGGYVLIYPSKVKRGIKAYSKRYFIENPIIKMPKELKELLQKNITAKPNQDTMKDLIDRIKSGDFKINTKDFKLKDNNLEGVCNNSFIALGGALRQKLNPEQVKFVLNLLNNSLLEDPMSYRTINSMIKELEKYNFYDQQELLQRIVSYLEKVEHASRHEMVKAMGESAETIAEVLDYLIKEGLILKRGNTYFLIKKINWKTTLLDEGKPVNFKVPYFYDKAIFNEGDIVLIGAKSKRGKTHLSINIVKRLVEQGIMPHYLYLETGGRYSKISLELGLKEGDFYHAFCADPTKVELEPNTITIIDWLLPENYAEVDKIFKHFTEQLDKYKGFLIVFMQLKDNGDWFSPNLTRLFPTLSVKYIYDDEGDGTYGRFQSTEVREIIGKAKNFAIPCRYDWDSKQLIRIEDEVNKEPKDENENNKNTNDRKED